MSDHRVTTDREALREILAAATNGGDWRVRRGHGADAFEPNGYEYVQFGPSEAKANGLGTDQLRPADANLIVAAVEFLRAALAEAAPPSRALDVERLATALALVKYPPTKEVPPGYYVHDNEKYAELIAAEYARLSEPTETGS